MKMTTLVGAGRRKTMAVDLLNSDGTIECTIKRFPVVIWDYFTEKARRQKKSRNHLFNAELRRILKGRAA